MVVVVIFNLFYYDSCGKFDFVPFVCWAGLLIATFTIISKMYLFIYSFIFAGSCVEI